MKRFECCLRVDADSMKEQDQSYVFITEKSKVAVVPIKQVLYIKEAEAD